MAEQPPTPKPAATVIVIRRGSRHDQSGLEVLMLQRGKDARFMPGVWVFAGGKVDPGDFEAAEGTHPPEVDADEWAHRIAAVRELGEEAAVVLGPQYLQPWSRWITPTPVPLRFDTRFYVAMAPPHCKPKPDLTEMDDARWMSPTGALEAGQRGEIEIHFPTIRTLEQLAEYATADELFERVGERDLTPILPKVIGTEEDWRIVLPWEPDYPAD